MAKNWEHAAGVTWDLLVSAAEAGKTLTYTAIASVIDTNPLSVRNALEPIQQYCLDHALPPLTSIVVGKTKGLPGSGFIAWDVDDLGAAHDKVFSHNWKHVLNPYGAYGPDDTTVGFAQQILASPTIAKEIYALVRVRGTAQMIFRAALLLAYKRRCAMCGIGYREVLDGAHIKAWNRSSADERISISNGLLLCTNHHRMFDCKRITVTQSYKIHFVAAASERFSNTDADLAAGAALHGQTIRLPSNKAHWPRIEYLKAQHDEMGWGNLP